MTGGKLLWFINTIALPGTCRPRTCGQKKLSVQYGSTPLVVGQIGRQKHVKLFLVFFHADQLADCGLTPAGFSKAKRSQLAALNCTQNLPLEQHIVQSLSCQLCFFRWNVN